MRAQAVQVSGITFFCRNPDYRDTMHMRRGRHGALPGQVAYRSGRL